MAPALVTSNTIVIKPSEETPINAFDFARLVDQAELPPGVFNVVGGNGAGGRSPGQLGRGQSGQLYRQRRRPANHGRSAPTLTRVNLELGGKAPAIVTARADLDLAAKAIL